MGSRSTRLRNWQRPTLRVSPAIVKSAGFGANSVFRAGSPEGVRNPRFVVNCRGPHPGNQRPSSTHNAISIRPTPSSSQGSLSQATRFANAASAPSALLRPSSRRAGPRASGLRQGDLGAGLATFPRHPSVPVRPMVLSCGNHGPRQQNHFATVMIIVHDFTGSPDFDVLPFFPQACDRLPIAPRNNE
jgi:hypothetical protein